LWILIAVVGVLSLASLISVGLFILPLPIAGAILLLTRPRRMVAAGVLCAATGFGPLDFAGDIHWLHGGA